MCRSVDTMEADNFIYFSRLATAFTQLLVAVVLWYCGTVVLCYCGSDSECSVCPRVILQ